MYRKRIISLAMIGVISLGTVGCGVKSIEPLSLEEVAGKRLASMTNKDKDELLYEHVSDRITVDANNLIKIPTKDMENIKKLMLSINSNLGGENNKALSNEYANYLLLEFAKSPFEWVMGDIKGIGYDPATRLYFVDVDYATNGTPKTVVPSSKIPYGGKNEEMLKQKRYEDYVDYLNTKYDGGNADEKLSIFQERWGNVEDIKEEQQGVSLLERTRKRMGGTPTPPTEGEGATEEGKVEEPKEEPKEDIVEEVPTEDKTTEETPKEEETQDNSSNSGGGVVEISSNAYDVVNEVTVASKDLKSIPTENKAKPKAEPVVVKAEGGNTVGRLTYSGLVNDEKLNKGAKMTMRYVLKYNHNLGEETDLTVNSVYLKEYNMDGASSIETNYDKATLKGVEVLKPFVDKLILSYNKAVESINHVGLNELYTDYGSVDKYYEDIYRYMYTNYGNYRYDIIAKEGNNLVVKVDRVVKTRAKGTETSMPTYEDTSIFNIELGKDDKIRVKSVYPISTKLIGEPLSVIKDVTGISELIQYSDASFTKENEEKVTEVLKEFSKAVYKGSVESKEFTNTVDMGVSELTLKKMADAITTLKAEKTTTYVVSWNTKSNSYVSLTLRDIYETKDGNYDTESVVDLANTNGKWKVVDYTRVLNVKTDKTSMQSKDALCINGK